MSEVSDYQEKLDAMSLVQLEPELAAASEQTKNASGEYGYWGGITKQEMVKANIEKLYENQLKNVIAYMGLSRVQKYVAKQISIKAAEDNLKKARAS